ncbi:Uncharacterized conserved protein YutE, UPF0331/DUF86 family [Desulfomicrobium apsheronum]|uniref:Uncharacterized conserved protein YutE, UPF0331/DUF86 family n=1 Tax=Desulfomicrobium apsheronum TaxID=52560 RepID=A0A1I3N7S0_9BACT|nr:HepT-like ribonuclease domain-containing protein [Desulfomicrobium apsheronum]SFJ05232.1 Uncharacterized conserved protein YutE, UPF0331/DUF86 family [Desulfomicrobium apsheronum]
MRDELYEHELLGNARRMTRILNSFHDSSESVSETDNLAIQRALQILVESVIGMSRYVAETALGIRVAKSRESLDELRRMGVLDHDTHARLLRIVGFRNILVHDYLNIDDVVVSAIVKKREYAFLMDVLAMLTAYLDSGDDSAGL